MLEYLFDARCLCFSSPKKPGIGSAGWAKTRCTFLFRLHEARAAFAARAFFLAVHQNGPTIASLIAEGRAISESRIAREAKARELNPRYNEGSPPLPSAAQTPG